MDKPNLISKTAIGRRHACRALAGAALLPCLPVPARAEAAGEIPRRRGDVLVADYRFGENLQTLPELQAAFWTRYGWDDNQGALKRGEMQVYADRDNHRIGHRVESGGLQLVAHATGDLSLDQRVARFRRDGDGRGTGIESGMIRSRRTYRYGWFEARIRMPAARGMWPAFWLLGTDGHWPPEIDIVETVHTAQMDTRTTHHFLHGDSEKPGAFCKLQRDRSIRLGPDFALGFHDFAVDWTPEGVTHYVDGTAICHRRFSWRHQAGDGGAMAGPAQVILNLAVGGRWTRPPVRLDDFPAMLECAWIRIWQPPEGA
jgi:hypothetical protein